MLSPASNNTSRNDSRVILYFLFFWTLLNVVQAYTLEIHADEAYYWLYSRFLDWGYYDHPPMVAVFIKIGDSIVHNELGLRLMTVLSSTLALYVLWLIVKQYAIQAKWFALLVSGIFIFHIYGFTTTPDAPLFLFTVLFYYFYKKYLEQDSIKWALILAVVITCLLYSKYHGVLLLMFTLLSNFKLLKRRTFFIIIAGAVVLYIPHIIWQANHHYISIYYHLFERSAPDYNWSQTLGYIPGQLLMAGPLIGWFLFYSAFSARVQDAFIRCLMLNAIGTFIFFFLSTIKGEVQPHWTLIAFVPMIILALVQLKQSRKHPVWLYRLAWINLAIIVVIRVSIISGLPFIKRIGQIKSYYGFKDWTRQIKEKVGDHYLVMNDEFQNPSKYDFYTNSLKAFAYDSRYYRRTQFDIWPIEDSLQHKRIYYLSSYSMKSLTDTLRTNTGIWYGGWIDDVRSYQKVTFQAQTYSVRASAGQQKEFDLILENPYALPIDFSYEGYTHPVEFEACIFKGAAHVYTQKMDAGFHQVKLKPGGQAPIRFILNVPPKLKGKFDLFFSIRTEPFPGGKNNRVINLTIE